ncbi:MAG: VWA domain-containing protein [Leptospiraceae bacterium]|nr:VWA domain-containing protein [Leptospiraceae bacterium]MCK6379719.1 VWA domain-containing protein [Leptospiraceae bacterium]
MIVYKYSPYNPEEENSASVDSLMSIISDLMMHYQISLDEAIQELLNRGLPVNIFLKEGKMDSLVSDLEKKIQDKIQNILETYNFSTQEELKNMEIQKFLNLYEKNPIRKTSEFQEILKIQDRKGADFLFQLKWSKPQKENPELAKIIDTLSSIHQSYYEIIGGASKYIFLGNEFPSKKEAVDIIQSLDHLTELLSTLKNMIQTGDIFNINLENIANYLGAESYQEFIEKRNEILENLKKLLKNEGKIIEDENGEVSLSPGSIQKIGRNILKEIFLELKSDESGNNPIQSLGESEEEISLTKKYEFGDSVTKIDYIGSITNSIARGNGKNISLSDLDIFYSRGFSKSSTVILIDMSGSMERSGRFYNAKKITLALDSLIRQEYKEDKLTVIGFGSTAKIISIPKLAFLQPYPVTIYNPLIRLKFNFSNLSKLQIETLVPMYFTNLQRGLSLARMTLSSKETNNKNIILITDGAPTAHFKGSTLHINYPPSIEDFEETLSEVKKCVAENISINTFLLTSDWDYNYFGEESFIKQFSKIAQGRVFYSNPNELSQIILYDFINNKKKSFSYL